MINIKKYRGKKQITQRDLARYLGVSRTTLMSAENDPKYCLSEDKARKLADFLGCSLYDLVDVSLFLPYSVGEKDVKTVKRQIRRTLKNGVIEALDR